MALWWKSEQEFWREDRSAEECHGSTTDEAHKKNMKEVKTLEEFNELKKAHSMIVYVKLLATRLAVD